MADVYWVRLDEYTHRALKRAALEAGESMGSHVSRLLGLKTEAPAKPAKPAPRKSGEALPERVTVATDDPYARLPDETAQQYTMRMSRLMSEGAKG